MARISDTQAGDNRLLIFTPLFLPNSATVGINSPQIGISVWETHTGTTGRFVLDWTRASGQRG